MRNVFVKNLIQRMDSHKKLIFATADLGYNAFEVFEKCYPNNFLNVGVAENNLIGISAGMALSGKKVLSYSILPFLAFRSYEQIRNLICNNNLNVTLIGGGGGFSYGNQGISHNTPEDINVLRTLPNITILNPATAQETLNCLNYILKNNGPNFIKLGKSPDLSNFKILKSKGIEPYILKKGNGLNIISTGNIISEILKAIIYLENKDISCNLISLPCIKPVNFKKIDQLINRNKNTVVIEENIENGGLSQEISLKRALFKNLKRLFHFCLNDKIHLDIGSQEYLRSINKLDSKNIIKFLLKINEI